MADTYKSIVIGFLAVFGAISIILGIAIYMYFYDLTYDESTSIDAPLEKNWTTQRYFTENNDVPLKKSEILQVVRVKVLSEGPNSATLEILYDSKDDAPLDKVFISAEILKDSGSPVTSYYKPVKAFSGHGRKAVIEVGVADTAKSDVYASNMVTINFYKGGGSSFHDARYEYERVWCRKVSEISNLWKQPYPAEKGSKYSINGARSISRLCI